jgi:hypothetical protein
MKTSKINLTSLQNDEHVNFNTEFVADIKKIGAENLEDRNLVESFIGKVEAETLINKTLIKSLITSQLATLDHELDHAYRGTLNLVVSNINHFNPQKALAADAVKLVFDRLGDVPHMGYSKEVTEVNKLVTTLNSQYAAQVTLLGLDEWITQLDSKCKTFVALMDQRTSDETAKPELNMRSARHETDNLYNQITAIFDAHLLIGNNPNIQKLIASHNTRIDKYKQTVNQRHGRNAINTSSTTKN